jgi:hypothetical protein
MSTTFLVALVVALAAVFYWKVVLMVVIAVLLAFVLTGITAVSNVLAGQEDERPIVLAPGTPGQPPDGGATDPAQEAPAGEGDPRAQEQPPR